MYKRIYWVVVAVLGLFSPALFALGLGGAVVESYLDQPLDVRVELISQSNEELQSITAGLASVDDFKLLGLSRAAISVPLKFELVTDTENPYIHITSQLKVNEPVVQVLVEVVWASGRMLREYTLFLDPPTFASVAPPVAVSSTAEPTPVISPTQQSTPPPAAIVRSDPVPEAPAPAADEPALRESVVEDPDTEETPAEEPAVEDVDVDQTSLEDSDTLESTTGQEQEQTDESFSDDEIYGPVARGETLWGIARDFSKGSGYSINQAMLALQRNNQDAFIKGNINSLKRGAILRLPAFNEIAELTSREAMLEVMRQGEEYRTGVRTVAADFSTPTLADSGDYQESVAEPVPEPVLEEDSGHLELVPPAEEESQDALSWEAAVTQAAANDMVEEELSRTEEDLVNAQQENTYLNQRIQELEAQVDEQAEKPVGIADTDLANMESSLAQERASDEPEPPVALTPGGEEQAWYAGKTPWIFAIVIVLIALVVWGLRRRNAGLVEAGRAGSAAAASVEAEDVPQAVGLAEAEEVAVVPMRPEPELEPEPEPEPEPESDIGFAEDEDEDAESSPDNTEIKLDLARAYLSLGDKEASKSMLDEVFKSGNESQQAEARQMLDEF